MNSSLWNQSSAAYYAFASLISLVTMRGFAV
jgi:hypothetical protein